MNSRLFLLLMTLCLTPLYGCATDTRAKAAAPNEKAASSEITPIPIEESFLEGKGLVLENPEEYDTYTGSEGKTRSPRFSHEFHTDKIHVSVIEAGPGKVRIDELSYDEFIQILKGRLILTLDDGRQFKFKQGDSLILPVTGYVGYWDMPEKYRELVVINTK